MKESSITESTINLAYIAAPNWWSYAETAVIILDEDMPVELQPEPMIREHRTEAEAASLTHSTAWPGRIGHKRGRRARCPPLIMTPPRGDR